MKPIRLLVAISLLQVPAVQGAANCQHSNSWQCQGHQSQANQGSQTGGGIATGGQTPNPGQTNPHLGTGITTSVPMMTLQPATQVRLPPVQVDPITAPSFTGTGKSPPQQVYLVPPRVITGYAAVPPRPVITPPPLVPPKQPPVQVYAVPPKTFTGVGQVPAPQVVNVPPRLSTPPLAPPRQVYPNPRPIVAGYGRVPGSSAATVAGQGATTQGQSAVVPPGGTKTDATSGQPSHLLVNNRVGQYAGGQQLLKSDYGREVVEPGIMNSKVALYRSHDVREIVFEDTIPMDATGFHLNFVGIREPLFLNPKRLLPDSQPAPEIQAGSETKTFVFFFDYASAAVHPDQAELYDEIVEEYHATGKRLILISETDGFGSYEYNTALATHRAETIMTELRNRGIEAQDIEMHLLVRYGRFEPSNDESHQLSSAQRIAWIHFE